MAIKIARFNAATLDKMRALSESADEQTRLAGEVRRVRAVVGLLDQQTFDMTKESLQLFQEHIPESRGNFEILNSEQAEEKYQLKSTFGAFTLPAGAFWPYRLITGTYANLLAKHASRFSIETNTPVLSITGTAMPSSHSSVVSDGSKTNNEDRTNEDYPFTVHTSRGPILARKVIHCTNGHTGHLLPRLRGKIFPLKGTVTVQSWPNAFPAPNSHQTHDGEAPQSRHKTKISTAKNEELLSWSFIHAGSYEKSTNTLTTGLYYMTQNEKSGDIFLGGEKADIKNVFVSDDTDIDSISKRNLKEILPTLFTHSSTSDEEKEATTDDKQDRAKSKKGIELKTTWSGIMGFTGDGLPLVGELPLAYSSLSTSAPSSHTQPSSSGTSSPSSQISATSSSQTSTSSPSSSGEYIAAGFNGYGMPQCWSCGEFVAKLALNSKSTTGTTTYDSIVREVGLPEALLATEERLEGLTADGAIVGIMGLFGVDVQPS